MSKSLIFYEHHFLLAQSCELHGAKGLHLCTPDVITMVKDFGLRQGI